MDELTSVVVVTYNALDMLVNCLKRVDQHTHSNYELIIIDNGSCDNTSEWIEQYSPANEYCQKIKVIINAENKGWPFAVNIGVKAGAGQLIALLNADIYVANRWLERLNDHLRVEPEAGMIAPMGYRIQLEQDYEQWYGTPEYLNDKNLSMDCFAEDLYQRFKGSRTEAKFLIDSCVVIRREVFNKVGLYDQRYFLEGSDLDFSFRAGLAGFRLFIAEDVFVHHNQHQAGRSKLSKETKQKIFNDDYDYFFDKWKKLLKDEPRQWDLLFQKNNPPWYHGKKIGRRAT